MIDKAKVGSIVEEWLADKDYFLVEVNVNADNRIVVEIDHKDGVWIEDCVALSQFIESRLSRDDEDYELEVGSAGLGQPFRVLQQYLNHVGDNVEVLTTDGQKLTGRLTEADPQHIGLAVQRKVKPEGAKRPHMVEEQINLPMDHISYTRYLISFK